MKKPVASPDTELSLPASVTKSSQSWKAEDIEHYDRIKAQADEVKYTSKEYTRDCMHIRNRHGTTSRPPA